jgi:hypothetical protein
VDDQTPDVDAGTVLDERYRIDALIGTGGMSRVYAAQDLLLGRTVAIKIITATGDDLDAGQRVAWRPPRSPLSPTPTSSFCTMRA